MNTLRVEELEPRHLLSGACSSPPPSPAQPLAAGTYISPSAERSPFVDFGDGHAGPVGRDRLGARSPEVGPSQGIVLHDLEYSRSEAVGLHVTISWTAITGKPQARETSSTRPNPDPPSASPDTANGSESAKAEPAAVAPPPELANNGHGTSAPTPATVTATTAAPPNPQSRFLFLSLADAQGGRAEAPGFFPTQASARALREGDGVVAGPGPSLGYSQPLPPRVATSAATSQDEEPAGEGLKLPPPTVPGVLASLPPLDLSALDHGLRQFLEQLDWVGQKLTRRRDGTGLDPWFVAAAAAAAACEIARRQFRRHADVAAEEANPIPGSPLDRLFVG